VRAAGYANLTKNNTYQGGFIRQHDKISFTRVFQAGHATGSLQPETVSKIFDRVMFDNDVATGLGGREGYSSKGPSSSFGFKNVMSDSEVNQCYTWDSVLTCTTEQL
jgi:hypothetical protein